MKIRPIFKTIDIFSFIQFLSRQTNYIIKFFLLKVLYLVYFDYRKHGQFEWTGPAILFVCLIFVLLAPNYIWGIVGL